MMGERGAVALHDEIDGPSSGLDGPPVLLLGSLGSALDMWEPQLAALTQRYQVVRVDHRGHGASPVPAGPYTVAELAGDVVALLDRLNLDRVRFVGLSLGAMVGMYLSSEEPDRIERLALMATTAYFPDKAPWQARIDAVAQGGTDAIAESVVQNWFSPEWAAGHPEAVAWAEESVRKCPDLGYLACCQAIRDWDHVHRLSAIAAPTLLICGTVDPATPEEPHAATIASRVPDVRFERVDGAHLLNIECADEVNALLLDHLGATAS
jgi:3-oxoadipate enol-lactonase